MPAPVGPTPPKQLPLPLPLDDYHVSLRWDPTSALRGDRALRYTVAGGEVTHIGTVRGGGYPEPKLVPAADASPGARAAVEQVRAAVARLIADDVPSSGSTYHGHFSMSVPSGGVDVYLGGGAVPSRQHGINLTTLTGEEPPQVVELARLLQRVKV